MSKTAYAGRTQTAYQIIGLTKAETMNSMGGACPQDYGEYRQFEALRKRRWLKFAGRRRVRWDFNFYYLTDAGEVALARGRAALAAAKTGAQP